MIRIPVRKKDYYLPENFNELTKKQLIWLARLMVQPKTEYHELEVLNALLNVGLFEFFRLSSEVKTNMLPFTQWVYAGNTLTEQLIPEYNSLFGPCREFDNLTLGEFHFSEIYYREVAKGDDAAVNNLIAVLYRKGRPFYNKTKNKHGDIRLPFNANLIAYYANKTASWPLSVKTAIVMWYDGCRQNLVETYNEVFSAPGGGDHNDNDAGMYGVIRNLSGDRFGKVSEVEGVFVHTAFTEIEQTMEDNRRIEAELKKHNR